MYEFLFLDLDETILDFQKAESIAIEKTLQNAGISPEPETKQLYSRINLLHWQMLERGEIDREQVKFLRFARLFEALGVDADAHAVSKDYERNLAVGHYFLPGAEAAVERLSQKYRLFLASNGTASVQKGRLTSADLYRYFEQVFISEEIDANKPSKEYFDRCFARIPGFDKGRAMIVGDSLTSDILGGNNAGITTCWVNPKGAPRRENIRVDYEIKALSELESLLDRIEENGKRSFEGLPRGKCVTYHSEIGTPLGTARSRYCEKDRLCYEFPEMFRFRQKRTGKYSLPGRRGGASRSESNEMIAGGNHTIMQMTALYKF